MPSIGCGSGPKAVYILYDVGLLRADGCHGNDTLFIPVHVKICVALVRRFSYLICHVLFAAVWGAASYKDYIPRRPGRTWAGLHSFLRLVLDS